jgi:hypothetical protein
VEPTSTSAQLMPDVGEQQIPRTYSRLAKHAYRPNPSSSLLRSVESREFYFLLLTTPEWLQAPTTGSAEPRRRLLGLPITAGRFTNC